MMADCLGLKTIVLPSNATNTEPRRRHAGHRRGQGIAEVAAIAVILIPFALAIVDIGALILSGIVCTDLAKQAARAAANSASQSEAQGAVSDVLSKTQVSNSFQSFNLQLTRFDNTAGGVVTVTCTVTVTLPVAVPILGVGPTVPLQTQHSEPIVGIKSSS
jgi:Flp pilus assembly protein TadG